MNSQQPQPSTPQLPAQHPADPPPPSTISDFANQIVLWIAHHWLAIFTTAWGLYTFLPFAAPTLMHLGWVAPARLIYAVYSFTCHQLPDHSYFLFGSSPVPQAQALMAAGAPDEANLF